MYVYIYIHIHLPIMAYDKNPTFITGALSLPLVKASGFMAGIAATRFVHELQRWGPLRADRCNWVLNQK